MGKEQASKPPDLDKVMADVEDLNLGLRNGVSSKDYFANCTKEVMLEDVWPYAVSFLRSYLKRKLFFREPPMSVKRLAVDIAEDLPVWRQKRASSEQDPRKRLIVASLNLVDLNEVAKKQSRKYKQLSQKAKSDSKKYETYSRRSIYWSSVKKVTGKAIRLQKVAEIE